jgi:hypothetical protein
MDISFVGCNTCGQVDHFDGGSRRELKDITLSPRGPQRRWQTKYIDVSLLFSLFLELPLSFWSHY